MDAAHAACCVERRRFLNPAKPEPNRLYGWSGSALAANDCHRAVAARTAPTGIALNFPAQNVIIEKVRD